MKAILFVECRKLLCNDKSTRIRQCGLKYTYNYTTTQEFAHTVPLCHASSATEEGVGICRINWHRSGATSCVSSVQILGWEESIACREGRGRSCGCEVFRKLENSCQRWQAVLELPGWKVHVHNQISVASWSVFYA